jgi:hypothetical protein
MKFKLTLNSDMLRDTSNETDALTSNQDSCEQTAQSEISCLQGQISLAQEPLGSSDSAEGESSYSEITEGAASTHLGPETLQQLFGASHEWRFSTKQIDRVVKAADHLVVPDIKEHLARNIPVWQEKGIWYELSCGIPQKQISSNLYLSKLSECASLLKCRSTADSLRLRMVRVLLHLELKKALKSVELNKSQENGKRKRGQRDESCAVDLVLQDMLETEQDAERQRKLRSEFADHNRTGKRWLCLTERLGFGLLLVCSQSAVSMV